MGMVMAVLASTAMLTSAEAFHYPTSVIAGQMVAIAVGISVPQRFAVWLCAQAWNRFIRRGRATPMTFAAVHSESPDRPLTWMVLAAIALCAGLLTALWPFVAPIGLGVFEWQEHSFVWSDPLIPIVRFVGGFTIGFIPLSLLGLAASFAHHLGSRETSWATGIGGWWIIGTACGVVFVQSISDSAAAGGWVLLAAALPSLLTAIGAALFGSADFSQTGKGSNDISAALPTSSDEHPVILRMGVSSVVLALASAVTAGCLELLDSPTAMRAASFIVLVSAGLGWLFGCRVAPYGPDSLRALGTGCAGAGLVLAAASGANFEAVPEAMPARLFSLCVGPAALAFTAAYGLEVLLHRVANRASEGAIWLGRSIVGAAAAGPMFTAPFRHWVGTPSVLLFLATGLLALGGILIVQEPRGLTLAISRRVPTRSGASE
jgi:hypothetical protein